MKEIEKVDICKKSYSVKFDEDVLGNLENELENYTSICDGISEQVDSNIDIYNQDLREWVVDNYEYMEQAIEEGLVDGTNYHKAIMCGQYLAYQEDVYNNEKVLYFNILVNLVNSSEKYHKITKEQLEEIAEEIDHNDNGSIFVDKLEELI